MEKRIPSSLLIFGWLSAIFVSIGTSFKVMHWPGASILLILGCVIFLLFYLPLWLVLEPKKGKWVKTIYQFLILFLTVITFLFKTQHWPFGGTLYFIWIFSVTCIILPISIVQLFRSGRKTLEQFHIMIILFFLSAVILGGIGSSASRLVGMANSFSKNTDHISNSVNRLETKNKQLYEAFNNVADKNSNIYFQKAQRLKFLTDSAENYIKSFRRHIIAVTENVPETVADTLALSDMHNVLNYDIVTHETWGNDEFKPKTGKFSGMELKSVIDSYRNSSINLVEGESRNFIKAGINLDTETSGIDEEGISHSWVEVNFRYVTLPVLLLSLKNIEFEIKNAETQILSDLLNSTKSSSDNLAAKVAELGAKLENQKKEKEIEDLKNQRQLSQMAIDSQRAQVSSANKVIIIFIVGMLVCIVMIFFVIRSNMLRRQANLELKQQKHIIEEKNKEITDSISYAKRLQEAILPSLESVKQHLPGSFVLYKPKDIVAGDFYWMHLVESSDPNVESSELVLLAAADCTGHGVPGAMVSVVCSNALNRAVKEFGITDPGKILDKTRELVIETFERSGAEVKDGMDISLLSISRTPNSALCTVHWSGANNPLWYIENGELKEITANKQPIGKFEGAKNFTTHELQLPKGSTLFLFTDGYADQFGGPKGKKFKYKQLNELILSITNKPEEEQKTILNQRFEEWRGANEQVDDVCIIGVRV